MRKSSWLVIGILIAASVIFLAMWYVFRFDLADPLGLTVCIGWWAIILVACLGIEFAEAKRRRSVRTSFLAPGLIYNPEAGIVRLEAGQHHVPVLQSILDDLNYSFDGEDITNDQRIRFDYIVRSYKFSNKGETWVGEVVKASNSDEVRTFQSRQELAEIIDAS